jgi:membrane protein implicated in regulation of membrane protease activity
MRFLPGVIAAIVAYFALPLLTWLEFSLRFLAFLAFYLIVAVVADRALKRYGN